MRSNFFVKLSHSQVLELVGGLLLSPILPKMRTIIKLNMGIVGRRTQYSCYRQLICTSFLNFTLFYRDCQTVDLTDLVWIEDIEHQRECRENPQPRLHLVHFSSEDLEKGVQQESACHPDADVVGEAHHDDDAEDGEDF